VREGAPGERVGQQPGGEIDEGEGEEEIDEGELGEGVEGEAVAGPGEPGHRPAGELHRQVAEGDRHPAAAAATAQDEPGDDGDVVVPGDG
jgi:hypothetical protein